jgi:hypothetical protein
MRSSGHWLWRLASVAAIGCAGLIGAVAVGDEPTSEFLRVTRDDAGGPQALQTAIASYRIGSGAEVDLVAVVHVGHAEYYQQLNRLFERYDAVLYELVAESDDVPLPTESRGGSPISALQGGMKDMLELDFQLDHIDYTAANFIHADMTPGEFLGDMRERNEGVVSILGRLLGAGIAQQSRDRAAQRAKAEQAQVGRGGAGGPNNAKILAAMLSPNRAIALRRVLAEQFQDMDRQMVAFEGADGRSTLVTERNRKAFEVLDQQLEAGRRRIAIFYGAGHLADMDQRLRGHYQAEPGEVQWLTAWRLTEGD